MRSAEPPMRLGHDAVDDLERHLAGLAGRDLRLVGDELLLVGVDGVVEVRPAGRRRCGARTRRALGVGAGEAAFPVAARVAPSACRRRARRRGCRREFRRRVGDPSCSALAPASSSAPSGEPCTLSVPALVGRAEADGGLGGDQRRLVGRLARSISAVSIASWSWPSISMVFQPEAWKRAIWSVESALRDGAVDGDVVVVPDDDQLVELEVAGQRDRFLADAFHQAAVAGQHTGVVVDEVVAELRRSAWLRRAPCRRNWRGPGRAGRWWSRCRWRSRIPGGRRSCEPSWRKFLIWSIVMSS